MNIKNKKEYENIQREVRHLTEKVEMLETKITKTTKQINPEILAKASGGINANEDLIIEYIELKNELENKLKELIKSEKELEKELEKIDCPLDRMIMRYRFVEGMTWKKIAQKIGCNETQIYRLRRKIFQKNDSK